VATTENKYADETQIKIIFLTDLIETLYDLMGKQCQATSRSTLHMPPQIQGIFNIPLHNKTLKKTLPTVRVNA